MKKIVLSSLVIIGLLGLIIGATGAYFNNQQTVDGNSYNAGEVEIDIRGAGASPITLTNMAPGVWSDPVEYQIYNLANSLPVKYRFQDEQVSSSVAGFYDKINVRVRHTFAGTPNPESWPIVYDGSLKDLLVTSKDDAISPTLGTNITHVYYLEFQVDSTAGNEFQDATAVANLIFDATQTNNPGWDE